jgi:hypothetical protein
MTSYEGSSLCLDSEIEFKNKITGKIEHSPIHGLEYRFSLRKLLGACDLVTL